MVQMYSSEGGHSMQMLLSTVNDNVRTLSTA